MKGPGLFSDIGKKSKELLTNDYIDDQKLTISSETATGLAVTSALKKEGLYKLHVASHFKYKKSIIDGKVDTDSNISSTLTFPDLLPSTRAITTVNLPDYNSGKVEVQYFHDRGSLVSIVDFKNTATFDLSATMGSHAVAFGAEVGFNAATRNFTKYGAAFSVTMLDCNISIILGDKGDTLRASSVAFLDKKQKIALAEEVSLRFSTNDITFTIGGAYAPDEFTRVKARLNNSGKVGALLQHELNPGSVVTISGEFDIIHHHRIPKFGFSLALKPR
ncbi:hypothetical protein J5N97_015662 [Dioscorea zingiberensis]|uniref:Uncharacterized protein n=1 Tax=Dioscorea zingiberensis TaxID=325984 RepID=A0A9D5HEX5_9LILI|nr:hypothetical protein J5N97_015662 [Dioscorea zingiberensis]